MSLDVYLYIDKAGTPALDSLSDRIFIREDGQTREITRQEWDERFPDREPVVLTADSEDDSDGYCVYSANITHNLGRMAGQAGIYEALWRPEEIEVEKAGDLVPLLRDGLASLISDREHFEQFNPENGWGNYDGLVRFTAGYLAACEEHPDARVRAWR